MSAKQVQSPRSRLVLGAKNRKPIEVGRSATAQSAQPVHHAVPAKLGLARRDYIHVFGRPMSSDYEDARVQRVLASALEEKVDPVCHCKGHDAPLRLSIYCRGGVLRVRRMKNDGSSHARECQFFEYSAAVLAQLGLKASVVAADEEGNVFVKAKDLVLARTSTQSSEEGEGEPEASAPAPKSEAETSSPRLRDRFGLNDFQILLGVRSADVGSPEHWDQVRLVSSRIHVPRVPLGKWGLSAITMLPSTARAEQAGWNGMKANQAVKAGSRIFAAFSLSAADVVLAQQQSRLVLEEFGVGINASIQSSALLAALSDASCAPYALGNAGNFAFFAVGTVCRNKVGFTIEFTRATVIGKSGAMHTHDQTVVRRVFLQSLDLRDLAVRLKWSEADVLRVLRQLVRVQGLSPSYIKLEGTCSARAQGRTNEEILGDEVLKRAAGTIVQLASRLNWQVAEVEALAMALTARRAVHPQFFGLAASSSSHNKKQSATVAGLPGGSGPSNVRAFD